MPAAQSRRWGWRNSSHRSRNGLKSIILVRSASTNLGIWFTPHCGTVYLWSRKVGKTGESIMKPSPLLPSAFVGLLLLGYWCAPSEVIAADWPQFMRGPEHTGDAADET